jgi:ribokinase
MQRLYPQSRTVLTLGTEGVICGDKENIISLPALEVEAVDTTGAGDTFIGYFVAELISGSQIEQCLKMGVKASALCVTRKGAGDSIPLRKEVDGFNV